MNKLENNLKRIKLRELGDDDKNSIWHGIFLRHLEEAREMKVATVSIFQMHFKKILVAAFAFMFVLSGVGAGIVTASDKAEPGSALFQLDLAVEKFQLGVASPEKKDKLRLKFAEERVIEVKSVLAAKVTTVQVLSENLETTTEVNSIQFSKEENAGVEVALNNLTELVEGSKDQGSKEVIEKAQEELLVLLGDDANLVVKRSDGVITVDTTTESETAETQGVENKDTANEEEADKALEDPNPATLSEPASEIINLETETEIIEGDSTGKEERFCRGEWREIAECEETAVLLEVKGESEPVLNNDIVGTEVEISDNRLTRSEAKSALKCTGEGGVYDALYHECTGISAEMCTSIDGTFDECASACRNDQEATLCTMQCVQICEL